MVLRKNTRFYSGLFITIIALLKMDNFLTIPKTLLYDGDDQINKSFYIASTTFMCSHCGKMFNPLDSLGKWECMQHTGKLIEDPKNHDRTIWSCCGRREGLLRFHANEQMLRLYRMTNPERPIAETHTPRGCRRADHRICTVWPQPNNLKDPHASLVHLNMVAGLIPMMKDIQKRPGFDPDHGIIKKWDFTIQEEDETKE